MKRRTQNKRINALLKTQPEHGEIKSIVLALEAAHQKVRATGANPPRDSLYLLEKFTAYTVKTRIVL